MNTEIFMQTYVIVGLLLFLAASKTLWRELDEGGVFFLLFVCIGAWPLLIIGTVYFLFKKSRD